MKMKATELIGVLDEMAENGQFVKESAPNLKGGWGRCYVYKETKQFTDKSVTTAGNIVMMYGSTIGTHEHLTDSETYTVICGCVYSNGDVYYPGETMVCKKGESHYCANIVAGESVLRFVKRK